MGHFSLNGEYTNTLTIYAKRKRVIINRVFSPPNDQNLILQINENNIKREKKLKKDDTFLNYLRQIVTFIQNKIFETLYQNLLSDSFFREKLIK